jgi:GNAT superfamily N-acetyltransferase
MQRESWRIERLDRLHDRSRFACGVEALDVFLRVLVTQYEKRCLGRTYVAVRGNARTVWGYYTIAAGSVRYSALPDSIGRKLPKHPVPTGLLARLAVDESVQGQGLGAFLLLDALARFSRLAE